MFAIYRDFSMLSSLPPTQPTGLKVENVHNFNIFQPIWLKLGMESLHKRTQHVLVIHKAFSMLNGQTGLLSKSEKFAKLWCFLSDLFETL